MNKTIQSRIQHPVHTAATLTAKNPVLLKGEVVYESDTRKHKIGDGATAWNALPYAGGGDFEGPVSASNITQDANHRFVTDAEKSVWNQACGQSSGSPMHDLFAAAGAVWDDSTKSWTVGTYTGLDNEQMAAIYAQTNNALCSGRWNMALQKRTAPVNLPPAILAFTLDSYISLENAAEAFRESLFEEINLVPLNSDISRTIQQACSCDARNYAGSTALWFREMD